MCLIAFAWKMHPRYKLIAAANRDEFYDRPSLQAHFWDSDPEILAGKDLQAGGTWMGATRSGKWAALTNYRDMWNIKIHAPSRGMLIVNYLRRAGSPEEYMNSVVHGSGAYNGFNLLCGNLDDLYYYSNVANKPIRLEPGVYGLSNSLLDTPWPKTVAAKAFMEAELGHQEPDPDRLFAGLGHSEIYPDDQLPDTGAGLKMERALSSIFIRMKNYGSRSSTVLMIDKDDCISFFERQFTNGMRTGDDVSFRFQAQRRL